LKFSLRKRLNGTSNILHKITPTTSCGVDRHIGRVDFDKATVYSGRDTRLLLEAAGSTQKPEIYYKYLVCGQEVEADSKYLVEQIAYQHRSERRPYTKNTTEKPISERRTRQFGRRTRRTSKRISKYRRTSKRTSE
jgi:hypothetical protein